MSIKCRTEFFCTKRLSSKTLKIAIFRGSLYNKTMKRSIPVVFIVVAAFLAIFFVGRQLFVKETQTSAARLITPIVDKDSVSTEELEKDYEDYVQTSFIELANDETLLNIVTMDIDGDGFDDQINIVKTSRSPYLILIVGLYNPPTATYVRAAWVATNITQIRTFACTSLDVIGNHKNSLVYQGVTDNGHSVLRIFNGSRNFRGEFKLTMIGNFEADGTIFIQQSERNEAYSINQAKAVSFPVWVYASDSPENSSHLDQIQTMYDWNEEEGKYTQVRTIRVTSSRLAAKELARIQDGTVATFAKFLDGLWYKTDTAAGAMRYIFFDYLNHEIIFQYEDSEEVYSWLNSNLRRNGMYFSAVNKSIENLQRRFDISLVNIDEVRLRIQDDVRMIIGESTLWDGNYKKLVTKNIGIQNKSSGKACIDALIKGPAWISSDETYFVFTANEYKVEGDGFSDFGRFMINTISDFSLLQFRSSTDIKYFSGYYSVSFGKITKTETDRRGRKTEKTIDDLDTILLQPVIVNPESFFQAESKPVILRKTELKKTDE